MRNISDNELDKLFQDAAQHIEPEFDPGDWDKLSKRIGRSERIKLFKRIGIYLSLALLMMFWTWLGIQYYQDQSATKHDSSSTSEVGAENKVGSHTIHDENENKSEINTSSEGIGVDGDDSRTSVGSESSASTQDQQPGEISSTGDQSSLSSGSNAATVDSKDIVEGGQQRSNKASATVDQSIEKNAKSKDIQRRSDAQHAVASSDAKDQNGNSINKSAERSHAANIQQGVQKQKRAVAGEEKKRDGGSLSASGNSNANSISNDQASVSSDQQKSSRVNNDDSSLNSVSGQNEKTSTQHAADALSKEENKKRSIQNNGTITSDSQRLSSTPVTTKTASGEKQKSIDASGDTLTAVNTRTGVTNSVTTQNNKTTSVNNQSNPSNEVKTGADTSSDSVATTDTRTKTTDGSALKNANATIANQSDNAKQNTGDSDSISTDASVENLLQRSTPVVGTVYKDGKAIPGSDEAGKRTVGAIETSKGQPTNEVDRVVSGSDSVLSKTSDSKSISGGNVTGKDTNTALPAKEDEATENSSSAKNSIAKENTSPTTGIPGDSLSDQSASSSTRLRENSNATAINDSTLAKSVVNADSLDHAEDNKTVAEDKNEEDKKVNESNWYVKLLVSPDFSAIGYNKPGKTGVNIGLIVEYSPAKYWGVSMGAIWSKKLYDKTNPGKSYSYGGTSFEADYLDGDCRVLDIPVNITYYILPEARLNFYATVGVSSYIMLKEDYVYTVTENNTNYYYYEDYKNENRHWFSMLNLSFGLQYRISPRLQLQAEPFLKAPMSGVGQGKIDLVSAGSFFTLKYRFNKY